MQIIEDGYGGNNDPKELNREAVASKIEYLIQDLVDLHIHEHMTGEPTKKADKVWKLITKNLNLLVKE
jgi:hypothetical protein